MIVFHCDANFGGLSQTQICCNLQFKAEAEFELLFSVF